MERGAAGRVSDVSFHKAIYSRCSNTETARAAASEEGPPTKEPLGFYTLTVQVFYMNYRFAFSVQYSLSAAASTHQLSGKEISSLACVGDPAEKGSCEWEKDWMKSLKPGRKLVQDLALGLLEPHAVGLSPLIQPVPGPSAEPYYPSADESCEFGDGTLDSLIQFISKDAENMGQKRRAVEFTLSLLALMLMVKEQPGCVSNSRQQGAEYRCIGATEVYVESIAAMSGILKRKFEEVGGTSPCSCVWESDDDMSSSESADSGSSVHPSTSNHFTPGWSLLKGQVVAVRQPCQLVIMKYRVVPVKGRRTPLCGVIYELALGDGKALVAFVSQE
ncbi:hypothetical protein BTVI_126890 [Pitangus sulphuratus]|nr:hypothetical protein BTVI_126890 [Pitangus sulphuratus]